MYKIAILVIIILITIYYTYSIHNRVYEEAIEGLWVSPDVYNENANIVLMRLFIGKPEKMGGLGNKIKRNARLLIDKEITDQDIIITYKKPPSGFTISPYKLNVEMEYTDEKLWNDKITFEFDFMKNSLRIYDEDELLGYFYKDNEISDSFKAISKDQTDSETD